VTQTLLLLFLLETFILLSITVFIAGSYKIGGLILLWLTFYIGFSLLKHGT
jgi:hypothetical protein